MNKIRIKPVLVSLFVLFQAVFSQVSANNCGQQFQQLFQQARQAENSNRKISLYEQAVSLCPSPVAYLHLGNTQLLQQQYRPALDAFNNASSRIDASNPAMMKLLWTIEAQKAQTLYYLGNIPEALATINTAIERSAPDNQWMLPIRKMIDLDDRRQLLTATHIKRSLYTSRSYSSRFGVAVAIDVFVLFDYNSDKLTAKGKQQANELADALKDALNDGEIAEIIGHTDKRGSAAYNLQLSQRRALSVVNSIKRRYPQLSGRLRASGRGLTQLLYPGNSEEDHRLNRRVEVSIVAQ